MSIKEIAKQYYIKIDDVDRAMVDKQVRDKGIEGFLNQQLVYLDCTKVVNGMRMMQTIGHPYKRDITLYLYALDNLVNFMTVENNDIDKFNKDYWTDKLIERHNANIEYERENPPIWYKDKSKKVSKGKSKAKEGDLFPEETKKAKISKAEAKLAAKLLGANLGFGGFKFKKD